MSEKQDKEIVDFLDNEMNNGVDWPKAVTNAAKYFDIPNLEHIEDVYDEAVK